MGIPLINVLYSDSSYGVVGLLSLPLLMYHICQLFIGNFQVPLLKKWIEADPGNQDQELSESTISAPRIEMTLPTMRRRGN
jgi:sodium/bile acid cotransporter 7